MSKQTKINIACPKCNYEQDFVMWESINATLNLELKKQLFNGELFRLTCSKCEKSSNIIYNLLYHDMEKAYMIFLLPDCFIPDEFFVDDPIGKLIEKSLKSSYCRRIVFSLDELIEKILIFDEELDDIAIEGLKYLIQRMEYEDTGSFGQFIFSGSFVNDEKERFLEFRSFFLNTPKKRVHLDKPIVKISPWSTYEFNAKEIAKKLPRRKAEEDQWLKVDYLSLSKGQFLAKNYNKLTQELTS